MRTVAVLGVTLLVGTGCYVHSRSPSGAASGGQPQQVDYVEHQAQPGYGGRPPAGPQQQPQPWAQQVAPPQDQAQQPAPAPSPAPPQPTATYVGQSSPAIDAQATGDTGGSPAASDGDAQVASSGGASAAASSGAGGPYRLCDIFNGQVSHCGSWYQGEAVLYHDGAYRVCDVFNGQVSHCGSWFRGEAPVHHDGAWRMCDIFNGQISHCGSWYRGQAVVRR